MRVEKKNDWRLNVGVNKHSYWSQLFIGGVDSDLSSVRVVRVASKRSLLRLLGHSNNYSYNNR